jgi:integrase
MNHFKTLEERQDKTRLLIEEELKKLKEKGFNPITRQILEPLTNNDLITPSTRFTVALAIANQSIEASELTKRDLKGVIGLVSKAAIQLEIDELPVGTISRKHIKAVLIQIETNLGSKSSHRYNKIRTYLMMLFKELIELEATEINPTKELAKRKEIKKLRQVLSIENRKKIDCYLKEHHFRFWIFVHIFFHSGARITEMVMVKRKDIDMEAASFKIIIKKGTITMEIIRPIKKVALPFWFLAIEGSTANDYIFSKGLFPGQTPIRAYQITKRWNRLVKKKLGIDEDFYSLKHLNLDETSAILNLQDASAMASHVSISVTSKYYTINESKRQAERLRSVNNEFA